MESGMEDEERTAIKLKRRNKDPGREVIFKI
jgi:hypothetical protein